MLARKSYLDGSLSGIPANVLERKRGIEMRLLLSAMTALVLAAIVLLGAGTAEAKKDRKHDRTPGEVVADLRAALAAQDWDAVASNYAEDAYVIDDQGILVGHADIVASYQSLVALFNGVSPTINQQDIFMDTVRVLYRLDAGWVVIPDGVDTFVIERGLIRRQTRHGLLEFTGPPPEEP